MTQKPIRIMLVDDHAIVREGYRALLERQANLRVIAETASGEDAYHQFKESTPDIVIMDLSMPGQGGIEAIRRIHQWRPSAKILVFSMHQNPAFAAQAARAGANGYVTKSSSPDVLVRAVYDVIEGKLALSPDIAQALACDSLSGDNAALTHLSPREFEILRLLVEAKSADEIAQTLHISAKTVHNCHYQIKRKLGAATDIELVRLAVRMKIVSIPETEHRAEP